MGSIFSRKELKFLIVGLDNSGKTSIINSFKPKTDEFQNVTAPTVGYSVEQFTKDSIDFTMIDMSGQGKYRDMWSKQCKDADGIIFVIDSTDKLRFAVVQNEYDTLMEEPEIQKNGMPILFFANKSDLPESAPAKEFIDMLGLKKLNDRPWSIYASNAISGVGISEGLQWLDEQITIIKNK